MGLLVISAAGVVTLAVIAGVLALRTRPSYAHAPATVVYAPAPTPVAHYFVPDPPVLPAEPVSPAVPVVVRFKTEDLDTLARELDDDYENAVTKINVSASMRPIDIAPPDEPTLSGFLEPRGHVHALPRNRTPRASEPEPTSPFRLETRGERDDPSVISSCPDPRR